jgi:hypothetical protein
MRSPRRTPTALTGLVTLAALVAGCAAGKAGPVSTPRDTGQPVPPGIQHEFDTRAAQVAKEWEASGNAQAWQHGFVPLADLTVGSGGDGTEATKIALSEGWYRLRAPLPDPAPPGTVTFPDGSTMTVPLETAEDAYRQVAAPPPTDCSTGVTTEPNGAREPCKVLTVTAIDLGTDRLATSRGEASVPVWRFTVAGLPTPVERVAVDPRAITDPPTTKDKSVPLRDVIGAGSVSSASGTTLTFRFMGGDADRTTTPLLYEDAGVVVVAVWYVPGSSDLVGVMKPLTVTLRAPLGQRVVLGVGGDPLPPTVNP